MASKKQSAASTTTATNKILFTLYPLLATELPLHLGHIIIQRLAHNLPLATYHNRDAWYGERAAGRGQTGIVVEMGASGNPLDRQRIAVHDAIGDADMHIGDSGQSGAFTRHDGLPPDEGRGIHAVLDNRVLVIVVLQLLHVPGGLVREMLLVLLYVLLSIIVPIDTRSSGIG